MEYLTKYFSANRMTIGVPKSEFLHRVIGTDAESKVTEFLLADLVKEKVITISGDVINAPGRSKDLSGAEGELARLIEKRFREAELQVPPVSELINTIPQKPKVIEGVISFLVKRDTLVRLAEGVYVHREVVENAREKIQTRRGETIDVAAFKEFFGLSRKVAIPLLEYFDRTGVTKRLGDRRQIL